MKKNVLKILLPFMAVSMLLACGCGIKQAAAVPTPEPTAYASPTPVMFSIAAPAAETEKPVLKDPADSVFFTVADPMPEPALSEETELVPAADPGPVSSEEPEPSADPEPVPEAEPEAGPADSVTIGAVGDIMVMPSQHIAAYNEETGKYSFLRTFTAMTEMFKATDLMCGNLEGAVAGAKAGYSNGVTDEEGRIRFNAPDEFAYDLKTVGFDVVTTANNHAGDCEADGMIATIDTVRAAGLYQTGTYADAADREKPLVIDVKGFKIGVLASTTVINGTSKLSHKQKDAMFSRLQYTDQIAHDVELLKNAGAEYIVMFAHWDKEYKSAPQKSTRNYAKQLLELGVDAVIGSHPHVVQPMTYMDVTRADGSSFRGFVAYSLGNFLSNMTGECAYELFLSLTLGRDDSGNVVLEDASYMPVVCYPEEIETVDEKGTKKKVTIHQVIPCLEDAGLLNLYNGADDKKLAAMRKAREHVLKVCGESPVPVMEDTCWIS